MKTLKTFIIAAAIGLSSSAFAYPTYGIGNSISKEIGELLSDSHLRVENEITVIVRFSLSDRHEILVYSIKSEDEGINRLFKEKLQKQKLEGKKWKTGKFYEVPVVVKAIH